MEHLSKKRKMIIMFAIMSAMLFASLNQTIVGTALPRIISDLGGIHLYSWVFTIFMLTSSVTAILVGKLSDIYGRKPFILIGIGIFSAGSLLSGFSQTIIQLIIYRGLQGFGAGMIMSTAFTAVGDLFSPRERGRWQGIMSSVFGLSSILGPTLGGWIVDNADWSWVFWVFLPVGVIAFSMIWKLFPSQPRAAQGKIDYFGSIFITLTIVPILLAFTWGGNEYNWNSLPIISLLAGAAVALLLFIHIERNAENPVLPLHLFRNSVFSLSNIISFCIGAGMFGVMMYMPMFLQGVNGTSALKSGMIMIPMTISMVIASTICGQLITKTGKYKVFALIGLSIMSTGLLMLSTMNVSTSNMLAVIYIIVSGVGLGFSFPVFTLAVQNAVSYKYLGVATASSQLFRQLGGTIGVAVMGTILNISMQNKLASSQLQSADIEGYPPQVTKSFALLKEPQILMEHDKLTEIKGTLPSSLQPLAEQLIAVVKDALAAGLSYVFLIGLSILLMGLFLSLLLKELPLRTSNQTEKKMTSLEIDKAK